MAFDPNLPYGATPTNPGFTGIVGPDGKLLDQYKVQGFGDPSSLGVINNRATSTGPSAWAQLLKQQQGVDQQNALDQSARMSAGANAQAMSQLARFGGLQGGAAERLAASSAKDNAFQRNAILRQGLTDTGNIGLADEAQKTDLLKSLPGLQLANQAQQLDTNKFNVSNLAANQAGLNAFNQGTYAEQMKAWGANRTANAAAGLNPDGTKKKP